MNDSVVATIARRAAEFQGYPDIEAIEIQLTSYQPGQEYRVHFDWLTNRRKTNRLSTFFAILEAGCTDCGTQFPEIAVDWETQDERWCDAFDCTQSTLTTRNTPGNALFWRNLDSSGQGRRDTAHAGLPALNGIKVGLNIWTFVRLSRFRLNNTGNEKKHSLRP